MKKWLLSVILVLLSLSLFSCADSKKTSTARKAENKTESSKSKDSSSGDTEAEKKDDTPVSMKFRDVYGTVYKCDVNPEIPSNEYDNKNFVHNGDFLQYNDDKYSSRMGIDVSGHQGDIDFKKVKESGIDFVIVRVAYRGYGSKGLLCEDKYARQNIQEASDTGLDVGVYVFSQAINEKEAEEEADMALSIIDGTEISLPVCFDPEHILLEDHSKNPDARTSDVSEEQFTKNAAAFCNRVKEAGYTPMVYANMLWEAFSLDLSQLKDIPVWYADYEKVPQTPYNFMFWQYYNKGKVLGVSGSCDMDIQMINE